MATRSAIRRRRRKARAVGLASPTVPENVAGAASPARKLGRKAAAGGFKYGKLIGGGLLGGLLLYELQQAKKSMALGGKRRQALRKLRSTPDISPQVVLRDRRRQQLLAMRRARLARSDPEAYKQLLLAVSGESPPKLARGEILLGRQPVVSPTASEDIDVLLEALG